MRDAGRWVAVLGVWVAAFAGDALTQGLAAGRDVAQASATAQTAAKETRAQAFVLTDGKGQAGAALRATAEGTALVIVGGRGKPAIEIGADADGPGISLRDGETGALLLGIGADNKSSGITLFDRQGSERVSLGAASSGEGGGGGGVPLRGPAGHPPGLRADRQWHQPLGHPGPRARGRGHAAQWRRELCDQGRDR